MTISRKSTRIGGILCFLLMFFAVSRGQEFLAQEEWGKAMLFSSLGAAFLVFPGVAVKWEKGWVRCLMMLVLMAAAPYLMLVAVERLNGNFLSDFLTPGEDIWENYVVYLLLYVAMFGLSGSVRISVMTVSPILLLFGIANMYVKEFKGSPLVPMDFSSIKTAGNVAVGYTYHVGYEIALGVCLTGMLMALASRLSMPKKGRPGRIALRLLSILVVGGFAYTFYFTDTVADFPHTAWAHSGRRCGRGSAPGECRPAAGKWAAGQKSR